MLAKPTYDELLKMYESTKEELSAAKSEIAKLKSLNSQSINYAPLDENITSFINTLPIAITISDILGNFVFISDFGLNRLGYTKEDIAKGLNVKNLLVSESDYKAYEDKVKELILPGEYPSGMEYFIKGANGEEFFVLIYSKIIPQQQKPPFMLSVVVDHSNYRLVSDEFIESEQKLREINAAKDKFFSIIAHDLKNPFNTIIGFSELLIEELGRLEFDQIKEYLKIMNKSALGGMNLLNNLLNWSLSQIDKIEFRKSKFDLVELLNANIDLIKEKANLKEIEIIRNSSESVFVLADKNMIDTVFRNLLSNAVKFTPKAGKIEINIDLLIHDKYEDLAIAQVVIADSGVGISETNLDKLFRVDKHFSTLGTEKEKGTGLGLLLCNDFIKRHEGQIWAESNIGEGSKFFFTLPFDKDFRE